MEMHNVCCMTVISIRHMYSVLNLEYYAFYRRDCDNKMSNFGNAICGYRIAHWLYKHKLTILAKIVRGGVYLFHNCYIPYTAEIGKGTICGYKGMGVVVHSKAVIGQNCLIGTNVTIGGKSNSDGIPIIGDNVYIATGAKVLANIHIGNNVVIGANAVMLSDAQDNTVWAGVPAKCIKINEKTEFTVQKTELERKR